MNSSQQQHLTDKNLLEVLALSKNATAIYVTNQIIIETANDAMIDFWGKDKSVIGKPLLQAVPELQGQPFVEILQNVFETGITNSGTGIPARLMICGELQTFYYDYEYRAIINDSGKTYCILHTATDVTERELNRNKLAKMEEQQVALEREQTLNEELAVTNEELEAAVDELNFANEKLEDTQQKLQLLNIELEDRVKDRTKALAETAERLKYMLTDAPVAIAVFTGRSLIIEAANKKVLEAWGKTEEIIGKPLHEAVPELAGQYFFDILDNIFSTGKPFYGNEVKAMIQQYGIMEEVYSNFVYQPLTNANGNVTSIMLTANIVTEQVLSRKKVEYAEQMLQLALEAANIGLWFINAETRQLVTTPRLRELFGFNPDKEITFEEAVSLVTEEYREEIVAEINNAITNGSSYDVSYTMRRANDQKLIWLRSLGKLGKANTGQQAVFSGVVMEITEQKQDEQRKNDFIGMVSHELKTPLTSLTAYTQLLLEKMDNTNDIFASAVLNKANTQVKKMNTLINGFLNISRLEAGKIQLIKQVFDLTELIEEMIGEAAVISGSHYFKFIPAGTIYINADRDKIGSVVSNLLSNAVKYSPDEKSIEINCNVSDGKAVVSVKDEGIGISAADSEKLFERFYRVDAVKATLISGFGIGLYLSAEIVERHDGKIWVDSEPGKGSVFYFELPLNEK